MSRTQRRSSRIRSAPSWASASPVTTSSRCPAVVSGGGTAASFARPRLHLRTRSPRRPPHLEQRRPSLLHLAAQYASRQERTLKTLRAMSVKGGGRCRIVYISYVRGGSAHVLFLNKAELAPLVPARRLTQLLSRLASGSVSSPRNPACNLFYCIK